VIDVLSANWQVHSGIVQGSAAVSRYKRTFSDPCHQFFALDWCITSVA